MHIIKICDIVKLSLLKDNKTMPQIIYMITCIPTGKQYIGRTTQNLNERWNQHLSMSKTDRCNEMLICNDIKRYGKSNFEIIEVERYEHNQLTLDEFYYLEEYYINEYNTLDPHGYNTRIGDGQSEESKAKISANLKRYINNLTPEEKEKRLSHLQQFQPLKDESRQTMVDKKKDAWNDPTYKYMQILARNKKYLVEHEDGTSFCSIGVANLPEITQLTLRQLNRLINPNVTNINGWNLTEINNEFTDNALINIREHLKQVTKTKVVKVKKVKVDKPQVNCERYHVKSPEGIEFCVIRLNNFAKEYNLNCACLSAVAKGKRKHHKNWTCIKIEN